MDAIWFIICIYLCPVLRHWITSTLVISRQWMLIKVQKMNSQWNASKDKNSYPKHHIGLIKMPTSLHLETQKKALCMISNYKADIPLRLSIPSHIIHLLMSLCFYSIPQTSNKNWEVHLNHEVLTLWHIKILSLLVRHKASFSNLRIALSSELRRVFIFE